MADFDTALECQCSLTVRCGVAFADFCRSDGAGCGEVAADDGINDVGVLSVAADDPATSFGDGGIEVDGDFVLVHTDRANVALHQSWVLGEVSLVNQFDLLGFVCGFDAGHIYFAITGDSEDVVFPWLLSSSCSLSDGVGFGLLLVLLVLWLTQAAGLHDDGLESVGSGDLTIEAATDLIVLVTERHEVVDSGAVWGFNGLRRCGVRSVDGVRCSDDDGFDICCVVRSGRAHEGIFAGFRDGEEFFGC